MGWRGKHRLRSSVFTTRFLFLFSLHYFDIWRFSFLLLCCRSRPLCRCLLNLFRGIINSDINKVSIRIICRQTINRFFCSFSCRSHHFPFISFHFLLNVDIFHANTLMSLVSSNKWSQPPKSLIQTMPV